MKVPVEFHSSQWPDVIAAQLQANLRSGVVPGRYLYDSPAQSARWLAYHEGWSPVRSHAAVQGLYDQAFRAALDGLAPSNVQYVSLGCGGGQKDARWVTQAQDRSSRIVLSDTSAALVLTAGRRLLEAGAPRVDRIVLDLSAWPARSEYGVRDDQPVVWSCLGILPNFDHDSLLPYLDRLMAPNDLLILSANLSPEPFTTSAPAIVPQYDNPLARAWYDGALLELGLSPGATDRRLVSTPLDDDGQTWQMRYLATLIDDVRLDVYGETIPFSRDQVLTVFHSTRYTPERLVAVCSGYNLKLEHGFVDSQRVEGVYLLRPS